MKRFIVFFLLLWSASAVAAGPQPCYFSGQYVKCFPPLGLMVPGITWTDTTKGIVGTTTNDNAAAGYVGEYMSNVRSSTLAVGSAGTGVIFSVDASSSSVNDGNETGITLTAGDWDVNGVGVLIPTTPVGMTTAYCFVGTVKGNSATGRVYYTNVAQQQSASSFTNGVELVLPIPMHRITLTGNTTYYLKCAAAYTSVVSMTAQGTIRARRVR